MSENRLKICVFEGTGSVWPKISGTIILSVRKVDKADKSIFYIV